MALQGHELQGLCGSACTGPWFQTWHAAVTSAVVAAGVRVRRLGVQEAVHPQRNQTILQADTPAQKANYSYKRSHPTPLEADAHTSHVHKNAPARTQVHRFVVLFVGLLVVAWLVCWWFDCAVVSVVLGDAGPLLLSPCHTRHVTH